LNSEGCIKKEEKEGGLFVCNEQIFFCFQLREGKKERLALKKTGLFFFNFLTAFV
jgi:hypothetical protein